MLFNVPTLVRDTLDRTRTPTLLDLRHPLAAGVTLSQMQLFKRSTWSGANSKWLQEKTEEECRWQEDHADILQQRGQKR